MDERFLRLLIAIPALVAGLTVHEFAHAWTSNRLGDDTARRMGRLTLDPLKHLDPIGTLFMVMGALAGFFFGWAKPVPFNPRNFQHPRRDAMLVAVAGPISNLLQVPIWLALVALVGHLMPASMADEGLSAPVVLLELARMGVLVNLTLAAFNMIPLPPLDGHFVLEFFGGAPVTRAFDAIRPYSFLLLIVLLNLPRPYNILGQAIAPVRDFADHLVVWAVIGQWL